MAKNNKAKRLQTIPVPRNKGPIPGQNIPMGIQPIVIKITAFGTNVKVEGIPPNADMAMNTLHEAQKMIIKHFIQDAINRAKAQPEQQPKEHKFMGARE